MKQFYSRKWFFPLAVLFLLAVIALGARMSYGAYIRRSYVKAVIATNETEKLFGSNLLYGIKNQPETQDDSWLSVYPYTVAQTGQESITVPIRIYNYLVEDRDRVNQLDVNYVISFRVTGNPTLAEGGLSGYSVNGFSMTDADTEYYLGETGLTTGKAGAARQTLTGRLPNLLTYDVTIPGGDLGKVSIAVKAERVQNDSGNYGTDLMYLAARVVPSLISTVQTATVTGSFSYHGGEQPADYAAYNYTIQLTGAPTAVILRWNPDYLELDPFFSEKYGVSPQNGQVIFNMEPGLTKVQFYRKGNVDAVSWDSLGVSVASS